MLPDERAVSQEFVGLSINQNRYSFYDQDDPEAPPPPPPPLISSAGIVAIDVTAKFLQAARTLEPGTLVKDGYFGLIESVGSIEIMDPKMDSGCLAPGDSLDEEYDVTRSLSPEQVLGVIDQLLCHEMAWHLGYPLSQTIFTNVYIEALLMPLPRTVDEAHFIRSKDGTAAYDPMFAILRAYCLGLLKSCQYVNDRIKAEHYYEEEDFVTNTYHRSLLDHIDLEAIRDVLEGARDLVQRTKHTPEEETLLALDLRLELRLAFLRAIERSEIRTDAESTKTSWAQMNALLGPISKTHKLAMPVPEAFSAKIQRKLASTMPPRPIVKLSFEEAHAHFQRLCLHGKEVTDVLDFNNSQSLLNFVMHFQAKKPQPLVYIRTLLQSYLFKDMVILGSLSIRRIIDDDLSISVLPCSLLLDPANDEIEAPNSPLFAIANQMELFRQRAAQSYLDIFRAFCQNRCRIRRTLCHVIEDWETLQMDAEEVDQILQVHASEKPMAWPRGTSQPTFSLPLSSWAYLYKLRMMEWIVQLGFELDIYQPDELAGMYWYLSHLARTRVQHLERVKSFTVRAVTDLKRKPRRLSPAEEAQCARSLSYIRTSMLDASVTSELADALSCLYVSLQRLGLIVPPPRPYSSDRLRYDIRMKPFEAIGLPELPSFDAFTHATLQRDVSTAGLLDTAEADVGRTKRMFEALKKLGEEDAFTHGTHERWVAATANGHRSAIATGLAVTVLRKAIKDAGHGAKPALKVEFKEPGKRYHEWWNVPGLVKA